MTLHLAPGFSMPDDAVTETFAILAKKRVGKSNAAVVIAEEMYDQGIPWVAIDPKGDWWGVRAAGDGGDGLSVLVFGGQHADVPLEPGAGRLVADLIVDQRITCVLDISQLTIEERREFLTPFAERLYEANRDPVHVFCEEAHEYIPQQVTRDDIRVVRAFERLVKSGGFRGVGATLITQRSASLNNDVLTQVDTLFVLRTIGPPDLKAIKAWAAYHEAGADAVAEAPTLANGEAWVFSPEWLDLLTKITFRRRRTFDSGRTPKLGDKPRLPMKLAEVNIEAIRAAMAETIERAEADDPRALRDRIAELERRLVLAERQQPEPVRIEVPVLTDEARNLLQAAADSLGERANDLREMTAKSVAELDTALAPLIAALTTAAEASAATAPAAAGAAPTTLKPRPTAPAAGRVRPAAPKPSAGRPRRQPSTGGDELAHAPLPPTPSGRRRTPAQATQGNAPAALLGKAERAILTALAGHPSRTRKQIALVTGYSRNSGGFRGALSKLRSAGYIADAGDGDAAITTAGTAALGDFDPPPTGPALIAYWSRHPRVGKAAAAILDVAVQAHPNAVSRWSVAQQTGYQASSGGFRGALSKLRTLDLITDEKINGHSAIRASDELFDAGGPR